MRSLPADDPFQDLPHRLIHDTVQYVRRVPGLTVAPGSAVLRRKAGLNGPV